MTGRGPGFLQCFRACVFHRKNSPTPTIQVLRCGVAQTMDALYLFQQCAHCSLVDELSSLLLRKEFLRRTTSATPESCAPCQFRKELVAQVSRSTVDDHLVDQSPFGALPEIECRLGAPKLKKSRRVSPRSSGLRSNLAQSLLRACLSAMRTTFDVICDSGRIRGTRLEFKVFFILPRNPLASSCVVWWHWELSAKIRTNTLCPDNVSNSF